jgi:RNA polymerase sigma-70 factor (ECF subfamily)
MKTRHSLLEQIGGGEEEAWTEVCSIYRPLILHWLNGVGVSQDDADDLTQEVMTVVYKEIGNFEHNGRIGAFRNWLRLITVNRCKQFFREKKREPSGVGGSVFANVVAELEDPKSDVSIAFDREHDLFVLHRLLQLVASEFEDKTMQAFHLYVIEGQEANDVAKSLEVSRQVPYLAKSRVMRRLRELAPQLMSDLECRAA